MSGYVCPECGLDYDSISPSDAVVAIRSFPRRFDELLSGADPAAVKARPAPDVWSPLEYTAHVADLFPVFTDTVKRTWQEDHPTIDTFWDPDARAAEKHYGDQDPAAVLADLRTNADALAAEIDKVPSDAWTRTATFAWGDRDLLTMVRNAVHEGAHHRRDVERALATS